MIIITIKNETNVKIQKEKTKWQFLKMLKSSSANLILLVPTIGSIKKTLRGKLKFVHGIKSKLNSGRT